MDYDERYFIEALSRGLRVLEAFSESKSELSLVEIATAVNLDKSTTFRLVYTLEALGYLERDPQSKRYRPALKTLRLGFTVLRSLDVVEVARPYLKALSQETGEASSMAIRDGAEIIYVIRISPMQMVNLNLHLGAHLPVYCTSMGKAQLIDLSTDAVAELLGEGPYEALTPQTITHLTDLNAELDRVRQDGYAVNDEELAIGLRSVAAPIRNDEGQIVAACNISSASARVSRADLEDRLAPMVLESANLISNALGLAL
jgi:IclR family transcriptional regulator, pca regulon regulatory protein